MGILQIDGGDELFIERFFLSRFIERVAIHHTCICVCVYTTEQIYIQVVLSAHMYNTNICICKRKRKSQIGLSLF